MMIQGWTHIVDSYQTPESITINSTVFSFTTSTQHQITPLMSNMSISHVTRSLNRTKVMCVDRREQTSSSAFIKVINSDEHVLPESR